jgi:hypothetical protein
MASQTHTSTPYEQIQIAISQDAGTASPEDLSKARAESINNRMFPRDAKAARSLSYNVLFEFSAAQVREASLEAQARCLEDGETPDPDAANRIRRIGPHGESLAIGNKMLWEDHLEREATEDLQLAAKTHAYLTNNPGIDRAAEIGLQESVSGRRSAISDVEAQVPRADRVKAATAFYGSMDDDRLVDATRAVQETSCAEIIADSESRDARIKALALSRASRDASPQRLASLGTTLSNMSDEIDKGGYRRNGPLSVMTEATTTALLQREHLMTRSSPALSKSDDTKTAASRADPVAEI